MSAKNKLIIVFVLYYYKFIPYTNLFYSILFYSILFYSILFYRILSYRILSYRILFYSTYDHCNDSSKATFHLEEIVHFHLRHSTWKFYQNSMLVVAEEVH